MIGEKRTVMRKILLPALTLTILLSGCSSDKEKEHNKDSKGNIEISEKKITKKKEKTEKSTTEKPTTELPTSEITTSENVTTETISTEIISTEIQSNQTAKVDVNNIQSQQQLESIIYSNNYSEREKTLAYQSAVDKGLIPMAPATELYAAERYRDSVNMQNGMSEKDIMRQKYESWIEAGIFTEEQMEEELAKFDY